MAFKAFLQPAQQIRRYQRLGNNGVCLYNYTPQPFKAYCAILDRRSNFRNQASPRVSTREHPAAEGGTAGEKCAVIWPKWRLPHHLGIFYMP